ncbi:BRD4-interacting chromatin-remodeling complex-associated protein-like [Anneissia japonica]|uniref:BRD4-interacting chromatin-remodeling complex-associated protein-like n=1 Tax=Anneissia japonica TaxID=1529436 RepID=UPI001425A74A|nr:BRD4-interacting chromatin-remodeling complex-associated protein-like [Anneissia japonica]XP_033116867.1 BRD4-interacting chromatin-remodeling complex-associated protein-like [Anneissia japonica]
MDDQSLMLSMQEQNTGNMDMQSKDTLDIFGDDDLFSDTMETNANPYDSLLSQAAAEAGVFPFLDEVDETMDSTTNQPVESQPVVTNQLVIPAAQPVVSLPQPTGSLPQKVNTMPVFNQTLQPMIPNQPNQATTAVLQVTPSGQQIIQQIPANAQGGQQILLQGLVTQLAPVKSSQGIIGTVQLQQGQQQPLTSFVLNTGGTRFPIQTAVMNPSMQQKLKIGKSGPVAISPKPSPKGPRHISPKPQPGQRVIQILPNQAMTRTVQIAPRAQGQPQTFLIRNPNMPGNLQLVQGINTGQAVIANSGVVRAPNYQVIQSGNPAVIPGRVTTQASSTVTTTQSNTSLTKSSRGKQTKNNALSNTQTTQPKYVAPLSSSSISSTALSSEMQVNSVSNALTSALNFSQPINSQPTIVTVTENKTTHPVITIGASGSMIVVKKSKPITVTASNPGPGSQTVVTSMSNQKSIMDNMLPQHLSQPSVFSNQQSGHFISPPSSDNSQMNLMQSQPVSSLSATDVDLSDTRMQFNMNSNASSYQSMQVPSPQQLPVQNLTKQLNIPAFANQNLSQSVPQTVQNNTMTFHNATSNATHNQYTTSVHQPLGQHDAQTSIGQSGVGLSQSLLPSQQGSTPSITLTHRQLHVPSDQHHPPFSIGLPQQQTTSSQALQGAASGLQNQVGTSQNQSDPQQKARDLQVVLQHNPHILKELMLKNPAIFQNSFKNNPQLQQKLQVMLQQIQQQQKSGLVHSQNLTSNIANTNIQSATQQPQQIMPGGGLTFIHNQSNTPSGIQPNLPNNQLIRPPQAHNNQLNTSINLSSTSNIGSNIQPINITGRTQPVISAQAAAIMKYPPNRSQANNVRNASVGMSSSINSGSSQSGLQSNEPAKTPAGVTSTSSANQTALNLPATFQISIKAQEQLQTIQNHIKTLTGMPNPTEQQTRLLQQLQHIQQKIVTQARQQMLAQQTRPLNVTNIQPQPSQNIVIKSHKKIASKNVPTTPMQNNSNDSTGMESLKVKQEPTTTGGTKTSKLTPYQQQIVRSFQEKLKNMTPEEQAAYIKSQQSLLLALQQQTQANQGQTSTGNQPIKVESKGTKRPAQYQLTRSSLMLHQIKQNQDNMIAPDLKTPFKSYKDAVQRLLDYHVTTDHTPTSEQLQEVDDSFEKVSIGILEKKQKMYSKYQKLIMQDSMKTSESSEMVMLGRILLQDEKAHFEEEKQMPHDQLIAKLRSFPAYKFIENEKDMKPENIFSDVKSHLISPFKIDEGDSETQDVKAHNEQDICSTSIETESVSVQGVTNSGAEVVESTPSIGIVSPSLDHRTKDVCEEPLAQSPKDCNGFITRELPVDDEGRQKTLKLKFKLRRPPSTLQDLLEGQGGGGDQDSEPDVSAPPTPTFDCSLNEQTQQLDNSYDVFEMPIIDNEVIKNASESNQNLSLVETLNVRGESIGSELNEEESGDVDDVQCFEDQENELEDEEGDDSTGGALSEQNQSAINHILSFGNQKGVEIPSFQDGPSDMYQSREGSVVNGLQFDFDDDDDAMQDFGETEKAITKLDQNLDDLNKTNSGYSYSMSNMQDPDLEEAVNSILF